MYLLDHAHACQPVDSIIILQVLLLRMQLAFVCLQQLLQILLASLGQPPLHLGRILHDIRQMLHAVILLLSWSTTILHMISDVLALPNDIIILHFVFYQDRILLFSPFLLKIPLLSWYSSCRFRIRTQFCFSFYWIKILITWNVPPVLCIFPLLQFAKKKKIRFLIVYFWIMIIFIL